jgi:trans-aconitate 2-methyltransferase
LNTENQKWNAEDYAKNSGAQLQWAKELISKLALTGTEALLDIGCGDGKITAELARLLSKGRVTGIDASPEMIRLAQESYPPETHPNLKFLRMDAAKIDLDDLFDVAFSNAVLHWVEDHAAVLRGLSGSMNRGGRILFQMGGRGNALSVFEAIEKSIDRTGLREFFRNFVPPYHFYGPEEYEGWLEDAGFQKVRAELIPKDMEHSQRETLLGWLRTTWFPFTDRLPEEKREPFLNDVVDQIFESHPRDPEGKIRIRMVRLEVEATRF